MYLTPDMKYKPLPSLFTTAVFDINIFIYIITSGVEYKDDIVKLFGHVTSQVTNSYIVWDLYAQIHGNCESGDVQAHSKVSDFYCLFTPVKVILVSISYKYLQVGHSSAFPLPQFPTPLLFSHRQPWTIPFKVAKYYTCLATKKHKTESFGRQNLYIFQVWWQIRQNTSRLIRAWRLTL